ncbi:MAG: histidinol-phosphatase HisJ family protein [Candidatus Thorarchaeota archaeon]|nr:MAG: histidinol-phosphatase HisJ family protein [Candidatus Thorarchaeota archaeon]
MRVMIDYHVHPNYSLDAEGSLEEYCEVATRKGLREIAFTTHLDSDPATDDCFVIVEGRRIDVQSGYWLEHYEASVAEVADEYRERGIEVRLGVEVDIYPGVAENLPEAFHRTEFDIIIGSVHLIDHRAISAEEGANAVFSKYAVEELGHNYFSIMTDVIESSFINVLGHIDLYRRYGETHYGEAIHSLWKPHMKLLTEKMKRFNVAFEINTSPWRKGQSETMPSRPILEALIERGITQLTLGSDAHRPEDVGAGVDRCLKLVQEMGFPSPVGFKKGVPYTISVL